MNRRSQENTPESHSPFCVRKLGKRPFQILILSFSLPCSKLGGAQPQRREPDQWNTQRRCNDQTKKTRRCKLRRRDRASGSKRVIKSEKEAGALGLGPPPSLETHQHARPRAQTFSLPVRPRSLGYRACGIALLVGSRFYRKLEKQARGFCVYAPLTHTASERASVRTLYFLFICFFFPSKRHGRTPARAHLHRRAHERQEKRIYKQAETPKDELMGNA